MGTWLLAFPYTIMSNLLYDMICSLGPQVGPHTIIGFSSTCLLYPRIVFVC